MEYTGRQSKKRDSGRVKRDVTVEQCWQLNCFLHLLTSRPSSPQWVGEKEAQTVKINVNVYFFFLPISQHLTSPEEKHSVYTSETTFCTDGGLSIWVWRTWVTTQKDLCLI